MSTLRCHRCGSTKVLFVTGQYHCQECGEVSSFSMTQTTCREIEHAFLHKDYSKLRIFKELYRNFEWVDNGKKTEKKDDETLLREAIARLGFSGGVDKYEHREAYYSFEKLSFHENFKALHHLGLAVTRYRMIKSLTRYEEESVLSDVKRAMQSPPIPEQYRREAKTILNTPLYSLTTLLQIAAFHKEVEIARYLIANGADVNAKDINGVTPLWMLSYTALPAEKQAAGREIAKMLIDAGADCHVRNTGKVALFNKKTDPVIAKYIKEKNPTIQRGNAPAGAGCYIATCVYHSYDCPEVWTLRRYRDFSLSKSRFGRAFIRTYYALSPTVVKLFGKTRWFQSIWKKILDRFVGKLNESGVENTPYQDKEYL